MLISRTTQGLLKGLAIFIGILIGIFILGVMIAAPIVFFRNFEAYDNPKEGISIRYPSDWEPKDYDLDDTVILFMAPYDDEQKDFVANVGITYTDFSQQPMTIKEYTDLAVRQMTAVFPDIVAEKPRSVNISGHRGSKLVFHSNSEPKLTLVFYAFLFDNTGYNITYTGKTSRYQRIDKYIVEVMIRSLKLKF